MKHAIVFTLMTLTLSAASKPRARDMGVPFDGTPGAWNAITDVHGIEVGHTTLIRGNGALKVGESPVRTGSPAFFRVGSAPKIPFLPAGFR